MKGFISFIIVLACFGVVLYSVSNLSPADKIDYSKPIGIEKSFQAGLNLKNVILDSAGAGAAAGFSAYLLAAESPGAEAAEQAAEKGAWLAASAAVSQVKYEDVEFSVWCGEAGRQSLKDLRAKIMLNKKPEPCDSCRPIASPECSGYFDADIIIDDKGMPALASLSLVNDSGIAKTGVIGISVYSEKAGYASASYIPVSEVVYLG